MVIDVKWEESHKGGQVWFDPGGGGGGAPL